MGTALAILGVVLVIAAAVIPGLPHLALFIAGLAALFGAAVLRARPSIVLIGLLLAVPIFIVIPDGFPAVLASYEIKPRSFFKSYESPTFAVGFVVIAVGFAIALLRNQAGAFPGAVGASKDLDGIVTLVGRLAAWLFIPMMLIIAFDVSQRKYLEFNPDFVDSVLAFSSTKLQEMEWHLHAALFLLCLGFAYHMDAHVRIELVRDRLGPRTRVWLELVGLFLFLIPYSYLVIKFGYTMAERAWNSGEVSAAQTGLSHRWIIKAILPFGFAILALAGISALLKCVVYLFGPDDLKPEVAEYSGTHHADQPDDLIEHGPITD